MNNAIWKYGAATVLTAASAIFIIEHEGSVKNRKGEHVAYVDAVGVHTACYGQTGKDLHGRQIRKGMIYTEEECMKMLNDSITSFSKGVNNLVKVPWQSAAQEVAITSFAYNVGVGNFRNSTLLKLLNDGKYDDACNQLIRWKYAGGKVLKGLETRREIEKDWCFGNIPDSFEVRLDDFISSLPKETFSIKEGVDYSPS